MPFGIDLQKIIEEDNNLEADKKIKEAIKKTLTFDEQIEENETAIRKRSKIADNFSDVDKALREVNFVEKEGMAAWRKEKEETDPEGYEKFQDWESKTLFGKLGIGKKDKTLEEEVKIKDSEKPFVFDEEEEGTGGKIKTQSKGIPFESEVGITESIGAALVSGSIKIPKGFMNIAAWTMDVFGDENIPIDEGKVAQFENWFDKTYIGGLEGYAEERARATAVGRLTEMMVQFYGGWKAVGKNAEKIALKAQEGINRATTAIKKGRYLRTAGNKEGYKLAKKVEEWNKLSGKQKFVGMFVGGASAGSIIYDNTNIGTFGDIDALDFLPTGLDREEKATAKEDAMRLFYNKLKFSAEMGFPIIPAIIGGGRVGKSILDGAVKRNANASKFDKFVEKFIAKPFRSRGVFPEKQFQAMQRLEGKKTSANLLSTDYLRNLDEIVKQISKYSQAAANASGMTTEMSSLIVDLIRKGKLGVINNKVVVKGFGGADLENFYQAMTGKLKIKSDDVVKLVNELTGVHQSWAQFLNTVVKGKNLNVATKEFTALMNDRIRNTLNAEYKIFEQGGVKSLVENAASNDVLKEVADIFMRSAKANGKRLSAEDAELIVKDIVKNVRLDKNTTTPIFKYEAADIAKDKALIVKNIAENITGGGKFKPDGKGGLIQTKSDLAAFNKLFGKFENANSIIANVTTDLAEIAARDRFYNVVKEGSDEMIKKGEIGIVYPTYNSAVKAFGLGEEIIDATSGLQLPQKLGEQAYTVPINGMFTTKAIAEGLKYGAVNSMGSISKNIIYQYAVMLPKGLIQAGKTVGGPFTHARNFSSGAVTTVALGNFTYALRHPLVAYQSIKTAFNTLQPQLLYRNKPGALRYIEKGGKQISLSDSEFADALKGEGGQALYRFLLEEGMVNQSAIMRDAIGLLEDVAKQGFLQRAWDKLGRRTKAVIKGAQDMYVAEDDGWKIWNFLMEDHKIAGAYQKAIKNGVINPATKKPYTIMDIPNRLDIMKMATQNVREMLPNYAYVSELVQASRRSILGNFVSWPAEIIRTSTNISMKSRIEMKDPVFKAIGVERAAGFAITIGTIGPAAVWGASQLAGFTKEKLMALREFVPYFSQDNTLLPVYEDGKYKYIDFSRAFFYDVVTQPFQTAFTEMNRREDEAVIPSLAIGLLKALDKLTEPFVSESIWLSGIMDLWARGGKTRRGQAIWNDRDSVGDKIFKGIGHLTKLYSPGSNVQIARLYSSLTGKTIKGTQYEISDELLGLIGLRKAPLDIPRSIEIMIGQFLKAERDERKLIYAGTLTGDPVKDDNKIIKQFIFANQQRLETYEVMRRQYDAAKVLGMKEKDIKEIFVARGNKPLYEMIKANKFKPFGITDGMKEAYERMADEKNIENPLSKRIINKLDKIEKKLKKQRLNREFRIDTERYLFNEKSIIDRGIEIFTGDEMDKIVVPEGYSQLPETPQPVVNNAQMAQNVNPITNLTSTQEALLSPTEKVIASRT
jgi:hypothetical protein